MADILTVTTGKVDCRLAVTTNDQNAPNPLFDTIAPTGYVYLRPRKTAFVASDPGVIVIPDEISLVVDSEGWAVMPDASGGPSDVRTIDLPAAEGMTWQVSFDLRVPAYPWQTGVAENRLRVAPFDIPVEPGTTTHIADYLPAGVDPSTGTVWVKGDKGDAGPGIKDMDEADGALLVELENGKILGPFPLPKSTVPGPVGPASTVPGPPGAGIPDGGSVGQVPARTAAGASEWRDVSSLVPPATTTVAGLMSAADKTSLNAAASKTYVDQQDAATLAAAKTYADASVSKAPDMVGALAAPVVVAHRGGASVYPEHSMQAYEDCVRSGFLPELDVQFLVDGTPVVIHDTTADRTLIGASGQVKSLARATWDKARVKSPVTGGATAPTVTFAQALEQLGGRTVLVIETTPGATQAQVKTVIDMIKARGLQRAVLMQSFDYVRCQQFVAAGMECVYLISSTLPSTALSQILADGIKYIGPSAAMTTADLDAMSTAGLRVIPYTVTTPVESRALPTSVFGRFSDDPWWTEGRLQAESVGRWERGQAWPARRVYGQRTTGATARDVDLTSFVEINGGALHVLGSSTAENTPTQVTLDLDHLTGGPITRPLYVQATFQFGRHSSAQGSNVGFTLYRNSGDPDATWIDAAKPGQEALTFALRRTGAMQAWEYTGGAAAKPFGSVVQVVPDPLVAVGKFGTATLRLEMTPSWLGLHHLESGQTLTGSNTKAGPLRVALRIAGTEATISDIQVGTWVEP